MEVATEMYKDFDDALRELVNPENRKPVTWYAKNNVVEWSNFIKRDDGLYEACGVLVRNCGDYVRNITIFGSEGFQIYLNSRLMAISSEQDNSTRDVYEYYPYIICVKTTHRIFPATYAQFGISKNKPVFYFDMMDRYDFWLEDGRFAIVDKEKMIVLATFVGGIDILNNIRPKYIENITISDMINETYLTVNDMQIARFKNGRTDNELKLDVKLPIGKLIYSTTKISPVPKYSSEIKLEICFEGGFDMRPETLSIDGYMMKIQGGCLGVLH